MTLNDINFSIVTDMRKLFFDLPAYYGLDALLDRSALVTITIENTMSSIAWPVWEVVMSEGSV